MHLYTYIYMMLLLLYFAESFLMNGSLKDIINRVFLESSGVLLFVWLNNTAYIWAFFKRFKDDNRDPYFKQNKSLSKTSKLS